MEIPKEIVGENKERDYEICLAYIDGLDSKEIKEQKNIDLTVTRIRQILCDQRDFLNGRVGWDKTKRLHVLQKVAQRAGLDIAPTKDVLNVIEQIRKEEDGDNIIIDQSQHNHINYTWNAEEDNDNNKVQPAAVPRRDTSRLS